MKRLLVLFMAAIGLAAGSFAEMLDLSTITDDTILIGNGDTVTGTLTRNVNIVIATNATVTLSDAIINVSGVAENNSCQWAGLTCLGDAVIVLKGANTVKGFHKNYPGIYVAPSYTLTIRGMGSLNASSNGQAAGIGCGYKGPDDSSGSQTDCGNIRIENGTITASGGKFSAGIGGSGEASCGNITIVRGTVTATGGKYAAAIGSGGFWRDVAGGCGKIEITGGTVTAQLTALPQGSETLLASAIGYGQLGSCDNVTIGAGIARVTAIADGDEYKVSICASSLNLPSTTDGIRCVISEDSPVTVYEPIPWDGDLASLASGVGAVAQSGTVIYGTLSGKHKISIAPDAYVTLSNATINVGHSNDTPWAGITCLGDAYIELSDVNAIKSCHEDYPGIFVPEGYRLAIYGHEREDGMVEGSLEARCVLSNGSGAGIGGARGMPCGSVEIFSGTITAFGAYYAAGIGGADAACGYIGIYGGTVTARSFFRGAGIGTGSGSSATCGRIYIDGCTVSAEGGDYAAGIGTGPNGTCERIVIQPTVKKVTAKSGSNCETPIGAGNGGTIVKGVVVDDLYETNSTSPGRKILILEGWDGNLSTLTHNATAVNGMIIHGTLTTNVQVSIAADAEVTLSNAVINGVYDSSCEWAGLSCLGSATITLEGANTVKGFYRGYPGIHIPSGETLVIKGEGSLTASSGGYAAGIGGGYYLPCGNIDIRGGTINSTVSSYAAGIGGGYYASCGYISISGANISATGGMNAAGIGGGYGADSGCQMVSIVSGTVLARGGTDAAGIGDGGSSAFCQRVSIGLHIDSVTAISGSSSTPPIKSAGSIGIDEELLQTSSETASSRILTIKPWDGDLATVTRDVIAQSGTVIHGELAGNYKVSIAAGATVTLSNASINASGNLSGAWAGLTCLAGDNLETTIVLEGVNSVHSLGADYPGIQVEKSTRFRGLNIKGDGELVASASINGRGAGIGGAVGQGNGAITIESGTITAIGGAGAAGIGSATNQFSNGGIIITGGSVAAQGGAGAAGIGCGAGEEAGFAGVTIYGGTVAATGGAGAAGIGKGRDAGDGASGAVEIRPSDDDVAFHVVAQAGTGGTAAIAGPFIDVDDGLFDRTAGSTRTIWRWDGNLAEVYRDTTIASDTTLYGELPGNYKISIEAGATVTLSNAVINGVNSEDYSWAGLTCLGNATINLAAGTVNTVKGFCDVYPGIYVPVGSTLTIGGTGTLNASSNGDAAGIGGGCDLSCGSIVIEGGTINANAGYWGSAGIGAGRSYRASAVSCGAITINGGTITASGGVSAAGIGGGMNGSSFGDIYIGPNIVRVEATCGSGAVPIGAGAGSGATCGTITIDPSLTDDNGNPTRTITGVQVWDGNLATLDDDVTIDHDMTLYGELAGQYKISISNGVTVTLSNAIITNGVDDAAYSWAGLNCLGDANIVLAPNSENFVRGFYSFYPGIWINRIGTLTISGTGSLDASSNGDGAGIGGGYRIDCGHITINGGTITATGDDAAGIGGGYEADCGRITINGGTITAIGNQGGAGIGGGPGTVDHVSACNTIAISGGDITATGDAAGIGSGYHGACQNIVVDGGNVSATSDNCGAGIGGADEGSCLLVHISGGTVSAAATGYSWAAGIGSSYYGTCGAISISGGTVTATGGGYAAGIGGGYGGECGHVNIYVGITQVVATRGTNGINPIGAGVDNTCDGVTVQLGLTDTTSADENTRTITSGGSTSDYAAWARANGVSGAWNATDANGIANVFRYAFNKPTGAFTEPPLLDITFNAAGKAVVKTPPLVNSAGFTFSIKASDNADGTGTVASYPLNTSGETTINETGKTTRFFRLSVVAQ